MDKTGIDIQKLEEFVKFYRVNYFTGADRRYSKQELWKLKAFTICAVRKYGFSVSKVAKAIHKHHSTLLYHLKHIDYYDERMADYMDRRFYEWCTAGEPPMCSMAWFRLKFPFPFRITEIGHNFLEMRVHPYHYELCKEIWRNSVPVRYGVAIHKDEDIVSSQIFSIGGNTYE